MENLILLVDDQNFEEVIAKSTMPMILAVGNQRCIDCRRMAPFFMQFAQKYAGKVQFASADSDACPVLFQKLEIQHIPTFFFIKRGKIQSTLVEPKTLAPFQEFIQQALDQ